MRLSALIFLASILSLLLQVNAQDKWQIADEGTVRLKPEVFSQLPKTLFRSLKRGVAPFLKALAPAVHITSFRDNLLRQISLIGRFYVRANVFRLS